MQARAAILPLVLLAAAVGAQTAQTLQTVVLSGTMGTRALLIIDGQAQMLAAGQEHKGVKLISVQGDQAEVERAGKKLQLRVGAAPVNVGGAAVQGGSEIVLHASGGGHFMAQGSINQRATRFMVDTGATTVAISQTEADRLGLDWKKGDRGAANTANGTVPAFRVQLNALRVGDVEVFNVEAVVLPANMPFILLGNSFLSRFQMRRDNDVMRLELKR